MDFIYRIPNLVSDEFCKDIIEKFENSKFKKKGSSYKAENGSVTLVKEGTFKKSTDIGITRDFCRITEEAGEEGWLEFITYINLKLEKAIDLYAQKFPQLDSLQEFELESYNIQRYLPGEGFYNWHCENTGYTLGGDRVLAWMIYLNDVEDGGTEFKTQNHIEKAEAGKFLIWPAYWTHIHRGQISNTKTKYIITGWYRHINE